MKWWPLLLIPGLAFLGAWICGWVMWAFKKDPTPIRVAIFMGIGVGIPAVVIIIFAIGLAD